MVGATGGVPSGSPGGSKTKSPSQSSVNTITQGNLTSGTAQNQVIPGIDTTKTGKVSTKDETKMLFGKRDATGKLIRTHDEGGYRLDEHGKRMRPAEFSLDPTGITKPPGGDMLDHSVREMLDKDGVKYGEYNPVNGMYTINVDATDENTINTIKQKVGLDRVILEEGKDINCNFI